jgi:hypothetical protein
MRGRKKGEDYHVADVAARLAAYATSGPRVLTADTEVEPELVERATTLLAVMPGNQRRETIEELISPHDLERGRRAVDALIEVAYATVDDKGRLRRVVA